MRSLLLAAAVAIALIACGGAAASRLGPASPTRYTAAPTPTPINVDDMMGLYAQQTVFVAADEQISAVTLLNHFVRYRIPTSGVAQATADSPGQFLYVLDRPDLETRIRTIDVATGEQRATMYLGVPPVSDRAIATAVDGRLLVLHADSRHAWVDAYEYVTLEPKGVVMEKSGCGDRLLASGNRVAIVCLATGEIAVDTLRGGGTTLLANALPKLAGATIAGDGTIYVVTTDQHLAVVAPDSTKLLPMPWPSDWSGTVVPDGIAAGAGAPSIAIAEQTADGAWLRVFQTNNLQQRLSVRLSGLPQGGIVALYPFAYYAVGSSIQHVDMGTGLLETMVIVGPNARPLAVVSR
jgi:outer membrane protein assembly factor BamB